MNLRILFRGKLLFGTLEQLGLILEKNFFGKQIWIPTTSGNKLDAMFFAGNNNYSEEPVT